MSIDYKEAIQDINKHIENWDIGNETLEDAFHNIRLISNSIVWDEIHLANKRYYGSEKGMITNPTLIQRIKITISRLIYYRELPNIWTLNNWIESKTGINFRKIIKKILGHTKA